MRTKNYPIAVALRHTLKQYSFQIFKQDLLAAFIVSLIALPLSMALAIAVGLPPQHGIYTAIIAGFIVPLLGGSLNQVTGPTAAFVVILAPIVAEFGLRGIVWCSILAGLMLIFFGILRFGKLINFIPYPVTTGFTAGIAVVLVLHSLNDFLGLGIEALQGAFLLKLQTILHHLPNWHFADLSIGCVTLFCLFFPLSRLKWLPNTVIAIAVGSLLGYAYHRFGLEVQTIGTHFSFLSATGELMHGVPASAPQIGLPTFIPGKILTVPTWPEWRVFLFPALTIAILAALESLLSATVADSISNQPKHHPHSELTGLGVGNILSGLAMGIPATGAIARTAANIHSGGKTPVAAALHAVFILGYVLFFSPLIQFFPMACLAALLINTAYRMSHYKQFLSILKIAPRSDAIVLLTCFFLTVFVDMVAGVGIGMICAAFLLIKRITEMTDVQLEVKDHSIPYPCPEGTLIYKIRGPLFFGVIEKAFDRQKISFEKINRIILDITDVPFIDMTGLVAINSLLTSTANPHRMVHIISNIPLVTLKIQRNIQMSSFREFVFFHDTIEALFKDAASLTAHETMDVLDSKDTQASSSARGTGTHN